MDTLYFLLGFNVVGFGILMFVFLSWYSRIERVGRYLEVMTEVAQKIQSLATRLGKSKARQSDNL